MHTHAEDKYRKKKAKEETNCWERQADMFKKKRGYLLAQNTTCEFLE